MKVTVGTLLLCLLLVSSLHLPGLTRASASKAPAEEVPALDDRSPVYGGRLVVALRSEPKTLNPVIASDISSREVIGQMTADLIHINRYTQLSDSALAKSWQVSSDGRHYTLELRHGLRFSDGAPLDADDVVFSFKVYLDERVNAPQRDSLLVGETPILVRKVNVYTVTFALAHPYASAERLFDSVAILPRHLLEAAYADGKLGQSWDAKYSARSNWQPRPIPPQGVCARTTPDTRTESLLLETRSLRQSFTVLSRDYFPLCWKRGRRGLTV